MEMTAVLDKVVEANASDLHLAVGVPPVLRVGGQLQRLEEFPALDAASMESLLLPLLTEPQREAIRQRREVELPLTHREFKMRCRIMRERGRLAAAVRVAPTRVPVLEELIPDEETRATFQRICALPRGLVLITGPTGSGKMTLCASFLEEINRTSAQRIATVEDPIEYYLESKQSVITQREIGEDVPEFPRALRSLLREDPDVVYISDLDNIETCHLALTLAETGHLVFATLKVDTVSEAVRRFSDAFPEAHQPVVRHRLSRTLQAVIAQRLLQRKDGFGRIAVHEILTATPRVRKMVSEGAADLSVAMEAGRDNGMRTMDAGVLRLLEQGRISREVAWFQLEDKTLLPGGPEGDL